MSSVGNLQLLSGNFTPLIQLQSPATELLAIEVSFPSPAKMKMRYLASDKKCIV